ncbi:sigma-54 dependent transcriptional regulator [Parabacteroides sp. PF5-9]|uniref:sigma-54-dependent transcriptional regulator n=1 Tax=Parabacteroides sp. PF5-9 TaxID=1742404 RepID=UPI002475EEB5|nr:sigma-54 dependent transcriptional regulator [Parabacteroides sp. PF5-9]MDH6358768.1 two-component system response regulator HydG [Parabacteroides sp. PF5-9]
MTSILIVEDDITFSLMLTTWLKKKGFDAIAVSTVNEAKEQIEKKGYDLLISDLRLPDGDGIDLLKWLNEKSITIPVIMITSYAEVQTAVQAIKLGASDYIGKPVNPDDLLKKINETLQGNSSAKQQDAPPRTQHSSDTDSFSGKYIVGKSAAAIQLYDHARLVAPTDMSVLITGSSGTGKEYVARYIHEESNRKGGPFIAVDCGAIPKDLAASEFFGHMKGSFTGAIDNKTGAFVAAQGGTVFLDEIGNLSYEVQMQLLRALQERKVKPIGSNQEITIDIRLISATNENLRENISGGDFREDLYHRINEFTIRIPDLKERKEDFKLFVDHFLNLSNNELNKHIQGFDEETYQILEAYNWPGNLRQMRNTIKYATLLATGGKIRKGDLPAELFVASSAPVSTSTSIGSLKKEEHESNLIKQALRESGYNKAKAARLLGIDRKTLYNKMKLYNLDN